jgi:hypothetical protein
MPEAGRSEGLRTIFAIFLGLMLTAFAGVGAYTFHPPPDQFEKQRQELSRREQAIQNARPSDQLTQADRDSIQVINRRMNELVDASEAGRKPWARSTSIILIVFATLVMAASLVRADALPVISNGLLLGGVFTMLYGVGWIVTTDTSIARFVILTIALVITIGLGYARFVSQRVGAATEALGGPALVDVERRLRSLEERLDQAAQALGTKRDG